MCITCFNKRVILISFWGGDVNRNNQQAEVFDHDRGTNGTFQLRVEGDQDVFEVVLFISYKFSYIFIYKYTPNEHLISCFNTNLP